RGWAGLALRDAQRAEGDALVDPDAVADQRGLADDHTGSVVDEERRPDLGAGVDVDAGPAVGKLGHHAWNDYRALAEQGVGHPVHRDCIRARVAEQDL